jgi:hypothetical protein
MDARELQPRAQDYVSQGDLYRALDDGLAHLEATLGADMLFIGPPFAQADASSLSWAGLMPVTDLASAREALVRIIEQGEGGNSRDMSSAHYGRFSTILEELLTLQTEDPTFEPSHPVAAAIVRTVEGDAPLAPFITDETTAAVSDLFNVMNDLLLQMLCRWFAFGHETADQSSALVNASVGLMFGAIKPLGLMLATMPVGDEHPGVTAGANFQLAYRSNFLLPHRRAAWIRFVERLEEAAAFAREIGGADEVTERLAEVAKFLEHTAASLTNHIELV